MCSNIQLANQVYTKTIAIGNRGNQLEKPLRLASGGYNAGSKCMASIQQLQVHLRGQAEHLMANGFFIKKDQYRFYKRECPICNFKLDPKFQILQ